MVQRKIPGKLFEVIFLLLIFSSGSNSLQSFDKQPEYTEVNPGEDAKLTCVVLNKKGTCLWDKDNKPLGIYSKKYEWAGNQESGDCSVWIRSATLQFDDGNWECRVTASDFTSQDSLVSRRARLVVRVAPQWPRIEHNTSQVLPGHNVTVRSKDKAVLKCVSRYGNPPATLKWFLGEEELESKSNQTNVPEEDNNRTWMASSTLEMTVQKSHHGQKIKCVALHESYPAKSQSVEVRLDITYPPEVRLIGVPTHDLEEGKDTLTLRCITDANPPASVAWRRVGSTDIASLSDSLQFRPVNQRDSGTYSCVAKNSVGSSQPLTTTMDVKYAPIIKSVGPDKITTATLYSSAEFSCAADGNPAPTYQWFQKMSMAGGNTADTAILRSTEHKLHFKNITYDYQGEYICVVTNVIAGTDRSVRSQPITLQVIGAPQVLKHSEKQEIVVHRGEDALLSMVVCADPRPRRTAWEWGSLQLEAGAGIGRYQAEELLQEGREDCYEARFHVRQVDHPDARSYYLTVENEKGLDRRAVRLAVRGSYTEPLPMMTVLTLAGGSLAGFLLCVLISVYIIKSQRCCCFVKRGDFKPTESDCEKNDLNSTMNRKLPKLDKLDITVPNGAADVTYCSSPVRRPPPPQTIIAGNSPEAMKTKRKTIYDNSYATGSKSSSGRRHKKRSAYNELQLPSVCDNGATINRLHHQSHHRTHHNTTARSHNKKLRSSSDAALINPYGSLTDDMSPPASTTAYFCPVLQQSSYNTMDNFTSSNNYNQNASNNSNNNNNNNHNLRTFPRHYNTYEKEII